MGLIGAVIIIAILLIGSVLVANFIWDVSTDVSADNVDIKLISCKETVTGSVETIVEITNRNDFRVLVEWGTIESGGQIGLGYADVPAKTIVTDQYYAYGVTECSAAIKSATRG